MKRILSACAVLGATLLLTGCDKVKDLIKVNVKTSVEVSFKIDPITEIAVIEEDTYENVANTLDAAIKAENSDLGIANIKSAKVDACLVTTSNSDANNNFQALNKLALAIKSDTRPAFTTFAEITSTPAGPGSIEVPVNAGIDLADYLKSNTLGYTFKYAGNRTTTKTLQCKARITYLLQVGL